MDSYDKGTIVFHWASAIAILLLWPIGKIMTSGSGQPSSLLYTLHIGLGLLIAVATLARVIWFFRHERPEELDLPRWERVMFIGNHYALYVLLALLSASGIVMLLAAGTLDAEAIRKAEGPHDQHELASLVFLLMFAMHVGGVVAYQIRKGRTLRRMGVPIGD
jgi:cytochrome b561